MLDRPYFMEKDDWYYFDFTKRRFALTDKAPKQADQSLKDFYADVENGSDL